MIHSRAARSGDHGHIPPPLSRRASVFATTRASFARCPMPSPRRRSRVLNAERRGARRCPRTPVSTSTHVRAAGPCSGRGKVTAACSARTRISSARRSSRARSAVGKLGRSWLSAHPRTHHLQAPRHPHWSTVSSFAPTAGRQSLELLADRGWLGPRRRCQRRVSAQYTGEAGELPDHGHAVLRDLDLEQILGVVAVAQLDDREDAPYL